MHPVLKDYASSPLDQSMSTVQLQRKAFLNWLLKRRQNNSESVESPLESPEFNIILQRTVLERVKYAIVFLKDGGELDENSKYIYSLLLACGSWVSENLGGLKDHVRLSSVDLFEGGGFPY